MNGALPAPVERNATADEALLRSSVAFVWLATGIAVLHPYYRAVGGHYLGPLGMTDAVMYVTCFAEVVLAAVLFVRATDLWQALAQTAPVIAFTVILTAVEPRLLVHPFGVLSKNLPLLGVLWSAYFIRREGWTPRVERLMRAALGVVWITEGLFPKEIFTSPLEIETVTTLGVTPIVAVYMIRVAGVLQIASGVGVFLLRGRALTGLLAALVAGLVFLPLLVLLAHPEMLVHPFGPLTKTVPILAGTWVLLRNTRARESLHEAR
jgi:hypothetical protein